MLADPAHKQLPVKQAGDVVTVTLPAKAPSELGSGTLPGNKIRRQRAINAGKTHCPTRSTGWFAVTWEGGL